MGYNVEAMTSKEMREMHYQNTTQLERATMLRIPTKRQLIIPRVSGCLLSIELLTFKI